MGCGKNAEVGFTISLNFNWALTAFSIVIRLSGGAILICFMQALSKLPQTFIDLLAFTLPQTTSNSPSVKWFSIVDEWKSSPQRIQKQP